MRVAFHFDIQTLIATQGLVCLVFALGLFVLSRRFRQVKGTVHLAGAFLCASVAAIAFFSRSILPLPATLFLTYSSLTCAELFFYYGVDMLLGIRARLLVPGTACFVALLAMLWLVAGHDILLLRVAIFTFANCIPVVYLLVDLVSCPGRKAITRPLIGSLCLYIVSCVLRAIAALASQSTNTTSPGIVNTMPQGIFQPIYLIVGVSGACGLGIFAMILVGSQVTAMIEHGARRDPLTDSLNRRGIEEELEAELKRAREAAQPLSLALIDIDHFKLINDTAGHATGDDTLRSVAASISSHLRQTDACGRLGGDEFLILLPGSHASNAALICERILHQVAALPAHSLAVVATTVSIGFTEATPSDTPDTVLARADRALYSAKRDGRNCAHMDLLFRNDLSLRHVATLPVRTSKARTSQTQPPSQRDS